VDAFYIVAQLGGLDCLLLVAKVLREAIADPAVNYAVTIPGSGGVESFLAEVIISFGLMMVLFTSNNQKLARLTGLFAGILVATYITLKLHFQARA